MKSPDLKPDNTEILQPVQNTPFACSSATELSGGLANATFRGTLSRPLNDGTDSVIIKHGDESLAKVPQYSLSVNRCHTEQALLNSIQHTPAAYIRHGDISVQAPRLYHYIPQDHTQVMQDYPHECTLHDWLCTSLSSDESTATALGEATALWLQRSHEWSRSSVEKDSKLAEIARVNSETLVKELGTVRMGLVNERCKDKRVRGYAQGMLFRGIREGDIVVQGDFSTRNILVQHSPKDTQSTSTTPARTPSPGYSLAIVDWEMACFSRPARDIGQILSDAYMKHYCTRPSDNTSTKAQVFLDAFMKTYTGLDQESAFEIVATVGEAFFGTQWYAPEGMITQAQIEELAELGGSLLGWGLRGMKGV